MWTQVTGLIESLPTWACQKEPIPSSREGGRERTMVNAILYPKTNACQLLTVWSIARCTRVIVENKLPPLLHAEAGIFIIPHSAIRHILEPTDWNWLWTIVPFGTKLFPRLFLFMFFLLEPTNQCDNVTCHRYQKCQVNEHGKAQCVCAINTNCNGNDWKHHQQQQQQQPGKKELFCCCCMCSMQIYY